MNRQAVCNLACCIDMREEANGGNIRLRTVRSTACNGGVTPGYKCELAINYDVTVCSVFSTCKEAKYMCHYVMHHRSTCINIGLYGTRTTQSLKIHVYVPGTKSQTSERGKHDVCNSLSSRPKLTKPGFALLASTDTSTTTRVAARMVVVHVAEVTRFKFHHVYGVHALPARRRVDEHR